MSASHDGSGEVPVLQDEEEGSPLMMMQAESGDEYDPKHDIVYEDSDPAMAGASSEGMFEDEPSQPTTTPPSSTERTESDRVLQQEQQPLISTDDDDDDDEDYTNDDTNDDDDDDEDDDDEEQQQQQQQQGDVDFFAEQEREFAAFQGDQSVPTTEGELSSDQAVPPPASTSSSTGFYDVETTTDSSGFPVTTTTEGDDDDAEPSSSAISASTGGAATAAAAEQGIAEGYKPMSEDDLLLQRLEEQQREQGLGGSSQLEIENVVRPPDEDVEEPEFRVQAPSEFSDRALPSGYGENNDKVDSTPVNFSRSNRGGSQNSGFSNSFVSNSGVGTSSRVPPGTSGATGGSSSNNNNDNTQTRSYKTASFDDRYQDEYYTDDDYWFYSPSYLVLCILCFLVLCAAAALGVGIWLIVEATNDDDSPSTKSLPTAAPVIAPTFPPVEPPSTSMPINAVGPPTNPPSVVTPIFICDLCGLVDDSDGITIPDATVEVPSSGDTSTCFEIEIQAQGGEISANECPAYQELARVTCGCTGTSTVERTEESVLGLLEVTVGSEVTREGTAKYDAAQFLLNDDPRFAGISSTGTTRRRGQRHLQDFDIVIPEPSSEPSSMPTSAPFINLGPDFAHNTTIDVDTDDDDLTLSDLTDDELIQRYLMILWYYQTTNQRQVLWDTDCIAIDDDDDDDTGGDGNGGDDDSCTFIVPDRLPDGRLDPSGSVSSNTQSIRWLSSKSECDWAGVSCNSDGHVENLWLVGLNIQSELYSDILLLPELNWLDLAHNRLVGTIPTNLLTSQSKLRIITINHNSLRGMELSNETFWSDSEIEYFNIASNQFSGTLPTNAVPSLLDDTNDGTSSQLKALWAYDNDLFGTIPEIYLDNRLQVLYLNNNSLVGPLPTIGRLTGDDDDGSTLLEELDLSDNRLTGNVEISSSFISSLKILRLHNNQLFGTVPETLYDMITLQELSLHTNELDGTLSESIGILTNLTYLDISTNEFVGTVPRDIGSIRDLEYINISNNRFDGTVPLTIRKLTKLLTFDIAENRMTGTITTRIGRARKLQEIYFSTNQFIGTVPTEILSLTDLRVLTLNGNGFVGTVPQELCFSSSYPLEFLSADCLELSCDCCTACCSSTSGNCFNVLGI